MSVAAPTLTGTHVQLEQLAVDHAEVAREAMGQSPAGLFGFSHMLGGYAGGLDRKEKLLRLEGAIL